MGIHREVAVLLRIILEEEGIFILISTVIRLKRNKSKKQKLARYMRQKKGFFNVFGKKTFFSHNSYVRFLAPSRKNDLHAITFQHSIDIKCQPDGIPSISYFLLQLEMSFPLQDDKIDTSHSLKKEAQKGILFSILT